MDKKKINQGEILKPKNRASKIKHLAKLLWKDDRGWTFVETLIVIAIALILTTMVGLTAFKQVGKARRVKAQTEIENAALALTSYYLDTGIYPTQEQGLQALSQKPSSSPIPEGWMGPYLSRPMESDPWGNEYIYSVPGEGGHPFGITSHGADGMEGGDDENRDIHSW